MELRESEATVNELKRHICDVQESYKKLLKQINELSEKQKVTNIGLEQLQKFVNRTSLIFGGLGLTSNDDCLAAIRCFCSQILKVNIPPGSIEYIHRLKGKTKHGHLLKVLFRNSDLVRVILRNSKKLSGSHYFVARDFPHTLRKKRKILIYCKNEILNFNENLNAFVQGHLLFVEGKKYRWDEKIGLEALEPNGLVELRNLVGEDTWKKISSSKLLENNLKEEDKLPNKNEESTVTGQCQPAKKRKDSNNENDANKENMLKTKKVNDIPIVTIELEDSDEDNDEPSNKIHCGVTSTIPNLMPCTSTSLSSESQLVNQKDTTTITNDVKFERINNQPQKSVLLDETIVINDSESEDASDKQNSLNTDEVTKVNLPPKKRVMEDLSLNKKTSSVDDIIVISDSESCDNEGSYVDRVLTKPFTAISLSGTSGIVRNRVLSNKQLSTEREEVILKRSRKKAMMNQMRRLELKALAEKRLALKKMCKIAKENRACPPSIQHNLNLITQGIARRISNMKPSKSSCEIDSHRPDLTALREIILPELNILTNNSNATETEQSDGTPQTPDIIPLMKIITQDPATSNSSDIIEICESDDASSEPNFTAAKEIILPGPSADNSGCSSKYIDKLKSDESGVTSLTQEQVKHQNKENKMKSQLVYTLTSNLINRINDKIESEIKKVDNSKKAVNKVNHQDIENIIEISDGEQTMSNDENEGEKGKASEDTTDSLNKINTLPENTHSSDEVMTNKSSCFIYFDVD